MARKFLDITEDSRFKATSPVAIAAWLVCFIIINIIVDFGLMIFIWYAVAGILCHLFFQYQPRFIYLTYLFLTKHTNLSPNFEDKQYIYDETQYENILKVLHPDEIVLKKKEKEKQSKIKEMYKKYLNSLKEVKNDR